MNIMVNSLSARFFVLTFIMLILGGQCWVARSQSLVNRSVKRDRSERLVSESGNKRTIEQNHMGDKPEPELLVSFEGLGHGFTGPQGAARHRNPSDNSLAVGRDHIVQTVNSSMAIFTKKGERFDSTGVVLYGPVNTNNVFRGFGGPCEQINNGDAVVRYDQLANRWLLVMPLFRRAIPGINGRAGEAAELFQPPYEDPVLAQARLDSLRRRGREPQPEGGKYGMCYAVSTSSDPLGSWYRYEFTRELFPDYPRPAVWPDGYYTPTSTGDHVIQKHIAIADRERMLRGEDATEQLIVIDSVNFLNTSDLDGTQLPPEGSPNIVLATGGAQLLGLTGDDGIYAWKCYVDWDDPSQTRLVGPQKIEVAPYTYLGGGQLTEAVPQPGVERKLDAQGDKLMARTVFRRIGEQQSIVAVHSVATEAGGGGVRWYEFRLDRGFNISLYQQGTYAPDANYRWMPSPAIDAEGNIGIGYSFGGPDDFPGQRFTGRLAGDPPGIMTLRERSLVSGEASQSNTHRWMDYTQTAIDPCDDMTIWYVGDYLKKGAENYSTRIGAFRLKPIGKMP